MAISETGNSHEAAPGDLDPEHSGNVWTTVTKLCNIAQVVFGLIILLLQVAWLGLGDLRLIGLLWVGPLVVTSSSLNLNKRCTSTHIQKSTTIAAALSPLAIVISLMFATISGIHDKISADVFIVSGCFVVVCFVALPVSLLSGMNTWVLLTTTAKDKLGTHIKSAKPAPKSYPRIEQLAQTAQPAAQPLPPPVVVSGTTAATTELPPTVGEVNHPVLSRQTSDGYEQPIPTRRARRFRKPKQIPTEEDGTRRALPDVPCETNNSEDDSEEEEFVLSEGYMTPSCEVLNTAHAPMTSHCSAKKSPPKLEPLAKKKSSAFSNPNPGPSQSQQATLEIGEYNEIPSSTEDAVYSETTTVKRIKPNSKIEPYSVSEVMTGLPDDIGKPMGSPTKVSNPAFQDGGLGGSPEGAACRVTEVTQEFGVRMIVTRQEVKDDGRYEEINDTNHAERQSKGDVTAGMQNEDFSAAVSQPQKEPVRESGYLEPSKDIEKSFHNDINHTSSTIETDCFTPDNNQTNGGGKGTLRTIGLVLHPHGDRALDDSCGENFQCDSYSSSWQNIPNLPGSPVRKDVDKGDDRASIVEGQSVKDSTYTHLKSGQVSHTAPHDY